MNTVPNRIRDTASIARMNWIRHRRDRDLAAEAGVPFLKTADLAARRGSDTLVVFGSGASINDISDAEWKWISRQDTMGVNFWPLHPFVPKMLMFELDARESRKAE